MPESAFNVSVTAPLTPAIQRMKKILFQPFDLSVWFTIGLAAWLAQLGRSGGGGGSGFRMGDGRNLQLDEILREMRDFFLDNLYWIVPAVIGIVLVVVGLWLLFTWLSSRGEFMLLHCVGEHKAEITVPWSIYGRHANSLFLFRVVLGLVAFAVMAPLIFMGVWNLLRVISGESQTVVAWLALAVGIVGGLSAAAVFAVISKFTRDFVVPIMFLHSDSCVVAWRRFLLLLTRNGLNFALYILFSIVLAVVIGLLILAVVLVTCCCAGCLFAIPYLGTVFLLPVFIFKRAYSAEYLAQYGPEFNVFRWAV